jgi:hypothetical protein
LMGAMQMVCQELKYSDCEIKESTDAAWWKKCHIFTYS